MRNLLILLLALLPITLYGKDNIGIYPKRSVVAGCVKNINPTDNRVVTVNYTDPILGTRIAKRLDEKNSFHTASDMCFTQNITVRFGGMFINVLVSPADSIFIDIDMNLYRKGTMEGISFSGKSSHLRFNKQFPAFYSHVNFDVKFDNSLPAAEFLKQYEQKLNEEYRKIDDYAHEHNSLPELTKWVKQDLVYAYANYLLDYSNDNIQQKLQVFTDRIFDIDNPKDFCSMMFPYHLSTVGSSIVRADSAFMSLIKKNDMDNACKRGIDLFMRRPASICRDYMLYNFLKTLLKDNEQLMNLVPKDCFTDPFFAKRLVSDKPAKQKQYPAVSGNGILYLDSNMQSKEVSEKDFMKYLAEKYKNKVVYIDVWATWCGPCKAEMKPAKELKKLFVGKDVVFVYLCLGSAKDKWLPAIDNNGVTGENYFFDEATTQLFLSAYSLLGYPSYLLLNRRGEVVTTNAPRPSNTNKIAEAIDALLK